MSGFRWDLQVLWISNYVSTPSFKVHRASRLWLPAVFILTDTFAEDEHVWIKEAAEVQIVCVANQIFTTPPPMRWLMRLSEQTRLFWALILLHSPLIHLFVVWWYLLCLCASPVIRGCCLATANQEASGWNPSLLLQGVTKTEIHLAHLTEHSGLRSDPRGRISIFTQQNHENKL